MPPRSTPSTEYNAPDVLFPVSTRLGSLLAWHCAMTYWHGVAGEEEAWRLRIRKVTTLATDRMAKMAMILQRRFIDTAPAFNFSLPEIDAPAHVRVPVSPAKPPDHAAIRR